jgi:hypothetical protein
VRPTAELVVVELAVCERRAEPQRTSLRVDRQDRPRPIVSAVISVCSNATNASVWHSGGSPQPTQMTAQAEPEITRILGQSRPPRIARDGTVRPHGLQP